MYGKTRGVHFAILLNDNTCLQQDILVHCYDVCSQSVLVFVCMSASHCILCIFVCFGSCIVFSVCRMLNNVAIYKLHYLNKMSMNILC